MVLGEDDLTIDGEYPSSEELQSIIDGVHAVHVLRMPAGERSLNFLLPVAVGVRKLTVTDWDCQDLRALAEFDELTELNIVTTDPKFDVDLSGLTRLRRYSASALKRYQSVLQLTALEDVGFNRCSNEYLAQLRSAPAKLELINSPKIDALPSGPGWENLAELTVHLARTFDASSLSASPRLCRLNFETVRLIRNFRTLLDLDSLDELIVENCPEIEGVEIVFDLNSRLVRFIGPRVPYSNALLGANAHRIRRGWRM